MKRLNFVTFLRYVFAGGVAFLVHLFVLAVLVELFSINELISTSIGFLCAVPVNFQLQRTFVFGSKGKVSVEFKRYVVVTATTFFLNMFVFHVLHRVVGLYYVSAQVITTSAVLMCNFALNYLYTFSVRQQ